MLGMASVKREDFDRLKEPLLYVMRSYQVLLPLYLLAALAFLSTSPSRDILHGAIWWAAVLVLGIAMPLILVMKTKGVKPPQAWLLFSCVLFGGFLLRLVLVLTGQQS